MWVRKSLITPLWCILSCWRYTQHTFSTKIIVLRILFLLIYVSSIWIDIETKIIRCSQLLQKLFDVANYFKDECVVGTWNSLLKEHDRSREDCPQRLPCQSYYKWWWHGELTITAPGMLCNTWDIGVIAESSFEGLSSSHLS